MADTNSKTPTNLKLFWIALSIGTLSLGGGISGWIFREFVTKTRWIDNSDFLSDMATARVLPGPNAINILALLSYRLHGVKGAVAALTGVLSGPFILISFLFYTYEILQGPILDAILQGAAAGAVGPLAYLVLKGVQYGGRTWYGLLVLILTSVAAYVNIPILLVVAVAVAVSFILVKLFGEKHAA